VNCTSCGANLQPGTTACPLCGTPVPYNANPSSGSSPFDPTVASSPYGGTPPPSTAYGPPSYGTPPPPNPYPYNAPPPQQQNFYGAPPPQQQGGYVMPPPQQMYPAQPPPKRRSRLGLILGIIAVVLIVACAGISFAVYQGIRQTGTIINSSLATVTSLANTPTVGKTIDPAAAAIIKNPQTSSAIDKNLAPTKQTTTFSTSQDIYVTFDISSNGQDGYIEAKWYQNGQLLSTKLFHHTASNDVGYFSRTFANSGDGVAEIYWCTKADCSDEQLAQIVNFTVA
jgi:flagellar basal body-associated protein FliL